MSERPPWMMDEASKEVSKEAPKEEKAVEREISSDREDLPEWMVGSGLGTDMSGDIRPGTGSNIRFWMPKGTEKMVIFITEGDRSPVIYEHQVQLGGSWRNWLTCLEPLGMPCPICRWANANRGQFARYKGQFFTIIDTTRFVDKSGKERVNEKRLLVAKKDTAEIIKRRYLTRLDAGQGLQGGLFRVYRTNSDKSASVGTDFEFVKMVDLKGDEGKELDYKEILAPDPEVASNLVNRLMAERGASEGEGASATSRVSY